MTEPDFLINHFFAGLVDVLWVNGYGEYDRMTCLGRDAGGILLRYESTGNVGYYPWHRIEEIAPAKE